MLLPVEAVFAPNTAFGIALFTALFLFISLSLVVPYVVLRLRDARNPQRDPQIGLKTALHYFFSLSVLLGLIGLATIAVDIMTLDAPGRRSTWLTHQQRTGFALGLAGLLFALIYWLLLRKGTNDRDWPATRRVFTGWRFAIHAGIVMYSAVYALVLLCKAEPTPSDWVDLDSHLAWLTVWGVSWVVHLWLLWRYSLQPDVPRSATTWDTTND